jgi:hypothetical protein
MEERYENGTHNLADRYATSNSIIRWKSSLKASGIISHWSADFDTIKSVFQSLIWLYILICQLK